MHNWRIKQLKEMYEQDPEDDFVIYALAQELHKVEELEESVRYFEKLRNKNPQYVGLYYHLADVYKKLDNRDMAKEVYERGIATAQEIADHHALAELKNAFTNFELGL